MRVPSTVIPRSIVRSAGLFFDFDGCQIAGHFSMFSSERIFWTAPERAALFDGLLEPTPLGVAKIGLASCIVSISFIRVGFKFFMRTHSPGRAPAVFKNVF